jgi:hypothetical protein
LISLNAPPGKASSAPKTKTNDKQMLNKLFFVFMIPSLLFMTAYLEHHPLFSGILEPAL